MSESEDKLKWERVEPNDPNRCQTVHADFQCPYKAVPGAKHCPRHIAGNVLHAERAAGRKYQVALWRDRIGQHADNPKIKDLSEEIGILTMLLERTLAQCKDDEMLLMSGGKISTLIDKITLVVDKWHKIQMQTNTVMDKTQATDFINALTDIIGSEIRDPSSLKRISERMIQELESRTNYNIRTI